MITFVRCLGLALSCVTLTACSKPLCGDSVVAGSSERLTLSTSDEPLKTIGGEFFGFNLETVEFQLSLWDRTQRVVHPDVARELRPFGGAVYRLPGGSTANYYRWRDGIGPLAERRPARIVVWTTLPRIEFGVDEYVRFLEAVNGTGWFIVNLHGSWDRQEAPGVMAEEAGALAAHLAEAKSSDGDGVVFRWELGNELDRGLENWSFRKYLHHAGLALDAIRQADPRARFVGQMEDYDAQKALGVKATDYNQAVARQLAPRGVVEYQQHLYFDGPPEGPWLPHRLGQLCQSIGDARAAGVATEALAFWVTELARWPQPDARGGDWKASWRKSADAGAAIGLADMMIALTQTPNVRGGFLHALHGTGGPWPMFHPTPGDDGRLHPSVTFYAYQMLRKALLPVVLKTRSASPARSGYGGGYDARGTVLASDDRRRYAAWAVNRWDRATPVSLKVPRLANRRLQATLSSLSARKSTDHNYDEPGAVKPVDTVVELVFDADGTALFDIPALSVTTLYWVIDEQGTTKYKG